METIGISLQEFLVKYSKIDGKFIKDFIDIQQSDFTRDNYPYIIDLEIISKWLQISEKKLRRTLCKSYKENIDYIISNKNDTQKSFVITVEGFKKICFKTKSAISEKIINYYLSLESLVVEYQKQIISELIKENSQSFPNGGIFYIIDLGNNRYKLAKTKLYDKVVFTLESDDIHTLESCIKGLLTRFAIRKNKEVYHLELKNIIDTIQLCQRGVVNLFCNICQLQTANAQNHISLHHAELEKALVSFQVKPEKSLRYLQQFGGEAEIIDSQPNITTSIVHDTIGDKYYCVKSGRDLAIRDEYDAIVYLAELNPYLQSRLPEILCFQDMNSEKILITDYNITGLCGDEFHNLSANEWHQVFRQLIMILKILEHHKTHHNALGLEAIMLTSSNILKISNLSYVTHDDCIKSHIISSHTATACQKMGWATEFAPGHDANRIFGELFCHYSSLIPSEYNGIHSKIIKLTQDLPYAIPKGNIALSNELLKFLK